MNAPPPTTVSNAGRLLTVQAATRPEQIALAEPIGREADGTIQYREITFAALDRDTDAIAAGLIAWGVSPGDRLALLVRPGADFVALVFAVLKSGATLVLIDPGMGVGRLLECLDEVEPDGFIAGSFVQAVRALMFWRFRAARFNVTVGWRFFWAGATLDELRRTDPEPFQPPEVGEEDPAAIIFTTGSTGPAKGVLYRHRTFLSQSRQIQAGYGIQPGEVDLPGFPLFGLFNATLGVTTILPEMDPTRPAEVDPAKIVAAIKQRQCTQAFGSPAMWNRVGRHCRDAGVRMPTLRRVLSAGAPVPPRVLEWMTAATGGEMHTPYGATEALPVATISAAEVLGETAAETANGRGTCVGRRFSEVQWRVIRITDGPLATMDDVDELPLGEIGELIVAGPAVTDQYVTRVEANATSKIHDGQRVWHRMGDVGYLDNQDRFWYCGRKNHRVETADGPLYTICCEAVFNTHERVFRTALVGLGHAPEQTPALLVEVWPDQPLESGEAERKFLAELRDLAAAHEITRSIRDIRLHPGFPVDIRHNAKIFRERLRAELGG